MSEYFYQAFYKICVPQFHTINTEDLYCIMKLNKEKAVFREKFVHAQNQINLEVR